MNGNDIRKLLDEMDGSYKDRKHAELRAKVSDVLVSIRHLTNDYIQYKRSYDIDINDEVYALNALASKLGDKFE